MNELISISNFLSSKVRALLPDPIELYTKWGMVPGVINGMHLHDKVLNKDIHCYLLKEDWNANGDPCLSVPVAGNYFTVFQDEIIIEESVLRQTIAQALEEYTSFAEKGNTEIFRNIHFFFQFKSVEDIEAVVDQAKAALSRIFSAKVLFSEIRKEDFGNEVNFQILATFSVDEIKRILNPYFEEIEKWSHPYGIFGSKCLFEKVDYCTVFFREY